MVRTEGATRLHTASFNWDITTPSGTIIPIIYNDPALLRQKFPLLPVDFACNGYLTDLYTVERPYSLPDAELPDYLNEDTRKQRTMKTYQMQWESPRFDANFYVCSKKRPFSIDEWVLVGTVPIINTAGMKYSRHRPFDLYTHNLARPLGEFASVGLEIQIIDHPITPMDKISIDLSWHQTAQLVQADAEPVAISTVATAITGYSDAITLTIGVAARQFLAARSNRTMLSMTNSSASATIYISTSGGTPSASSNNGTVSPGEAKEFPGATGIISAASSAASTVVTAREHYNQ